MKSIELSNLPALVPLVTSGSNEVVVLTQNGETVAAVVPGDAQDVESLLLSVNPQFQAILNRSQERLDSEGAISSAEVRKRLGLPPSPPTI
jgi:antitoxin (DNA-binding transcriptional repressor) of toxin-antitoxin stability system